MLIVPYNAPREWRSKWLTWKLLSLVNELRLILAYHFSRPLSIVYYFLLIFLDKRADILVLQTGFSPVSNAVVHLSISCSSLRLLVQELLVSIEEEAYLSITAVQGILAKSVLVASDYTVNFYWLKHYLLLLLRFFLLNRLLLIIRVLPPMEKNVRLKSLGSGILIVLRLLLCWLFISDLYIILPQRLIIVLGLHRILELMLPWLLIVMVGIIDVCITIVALMIFSRVLVIAHLFYC